MGGFGRSGAFKSGRVSGTHNLIRASIKPRTSFGKIGMENIPRLASAVSGRSGLRSCSADIGTDMHSSKKIQKNPLLILTEN